MEMHLVLSWQNRLGRTVNGPGLDIYMHLLKWAGPGRLKVNGPGQIIQAYAQI